MRSRNSTPRPSSSASRSPSRHSDSGCVAKASSPPANKPGDELPFVKLRYKLPGQTSSRLIEQPVRAADALAQFDSAPVEQRFAVAVAAFGQWLRGESALEDFKLAKIAALANAARGADPEGYRAEFVRLIRMAESLEKVAQK